MCLTSKGCIKMASGLASETSAIDAYIFRGQAWNAVQETRSCSSPKEVNFRWRRGGSPPLIKAYSTPPYPRLGIGRAHNAWVL